LRKMPGKWSFTLRIYTRKSSGASLLYILCIFC
jgi:hypothetical protein